MARSRPSDAGNAGSSASPPPEVGRVDDVDQALDRLYAVDPEGFVAERDRLSRELRDAGHKDEAKLVKAVRKPTLSAWTVNQLARQARREIDLLLDASHRLREAQQGLLTGADQRSFDEARRTQREALTGLRKAASGILTDAGRGSETTLNQVMATLQAAAVSDEGRELLARGRLSGDVEATGFELLSPLAGPPAAKPRAPAQRKPSKGAAARPSEQRPTEAQRRRERRERLEEAKNELREARAAAKAATAELRGAQKEAAKAERELARAEETLRKTEAKAARADEAVKDAETRVRDAER